MSYQDKFKNRPPEETTAILTEFFESRGFHIVSCAVSNEINTWSYHMKLFYKDILVLTSNGKGMTKKFAYASGLAELYERFCGASIIMDSKIAYDKYLDLKGHTEPLNIDDIYNIPIINHIFCEKMFDNDIEKSKEFVRYYLNNNPVKDEFSNIITGEKLYLDKRLTYLIDGTNGLAAGNTFEEAFCQGFSEICERLAMMWFIGRYEDRPHIIKNENIENKELREKISALENNGYKVYIIDLSYNYNLPVVYLLVYDLIGHRTHSNFGCFPVFDIALERCFTEMFQNLRELRGTMPNELQVPFRHNNPRRAMAKSCMNSSVSYHYTPKDMIKNAEWVDSYNKDVYARETDDTYQYWIDFIKINKWNIYVLDNSISNKMFAIKIFCKDLMTSIYDENIEENLGIKWEIVFDICNCCKNIIDSIINNDYDYEKFNFNYKRLITYMNEWENEYTYTIRRIYWDGPTVLVRRPTSLFENGFDFYNMILDGEITDQIPEHNDYFEFPYFIKYVLLGRYLHFGKYSKEEIMEIGKQLGIEYNDRDFLMWNDKPYLVEQIYYKPLWEFYKTQDYENIIKAYLKR